VLLEHLESLLNKFSKVLLLPLAVIDLVAEVGVLGLHQVKNGEDLAVVGDHGFANSVSALHEALQNLQGNCNDIGVTRVQCSLDGNDELWNDREDLGTALFKHVERALDRQESVWILLLANALEEDGEVVMVVEGHDVDLPEDLVRGAVLDGNGQVSSVVEATELRWRNDAPVGGSCLGLLRGWTLLWLVERGVRSAHAASFLKRLAGSSGSSRTSVGTIFFLLLLRHVCGWEVSKWRVL